MGQRLNKKLQSRHFTRGMSLPEILAAVLIGLIGMIVIMQVYATSEERKRTTTGTSDAQISGSIAMFTLQSTIRSAGFGMVSADNNMLGCTTRAYNSIRPTPDFTFLMAPVVITVGAAGAPDRLTVIYGSSPNVVEGEEFVSGATSGADFPLKNAAGILAGDLVVASEPSDPLLPPVVNCSLAEVTGFVPAAINTVQHPNGAAYSYVDSAGNTISPTATYNKGGGSGVDYSANALLFSLGRSPTVVTYQIGNDKLQTKTLIPYVPAQDSDGDGTTDADIGDGIVQLKALYGKDINGDGVVDTSEWNNPLNIVTPTTAAQWMQVRAVRVALLARSAKFEKTAVTPAAPTWNGGTAFTMTNPVDGTDWHYYRYRVYEAVVPLRNMIWSN